MQHPRVNSQTIGEFDLLIPDLPVQQRVADKIEELFSQLDAGVAELQEAKARLERYRQSVLKAAVTGELTREWREAHQDELEPAEQLLERILKERRAKWEEEEWAKLVERAKKKVAQKERKAAGLPYYIRDLEPEDWEHIAEEEYQQYLPKDDKWKEKYPNPKNPDSKEIQDKPREWSIGYLDTISEIILGQSPPSSTYNEIGVGLPFYQGKAEFGDLYPAPKKWCSIPKKIANKNDILISVRAPVGPTNLCPEESCIGRGLAAIRPYKLVSFMYVLQFLRHYEPILSGQGTGTTFNAITGDQLKQLTIPLPTKAEQDRIVNMIDRRLSVAKEIEDGIEKELRRAKRLRQSILKQAFDGKLINE